MAKQDLKMGFVNIFSEVPLSEDLLIVGFLNKKKGELATSINRVARITRDGVITAQGTFYPFEEAHDLYLHFLIEANKKNTLIATLWEKVGKGRIIADIMQNGEFKKTVTFDFEPSKRHNVMFAGYSKELSSNVVITTFARRHVCITLGIPKSLKFDIIRSSIASKKETMEKVKAVQDIFSKTFE